MAAVIQITLEGSLNDPTHNRLDDFDLANADVRVVYQIDNESAPIMNGDFTALGFVLSVFVPLSAEVQFSNRPNGMPDVALSLSNLQVEVVNAFPPPPFASCTPDIICFTDQILLGGELTGEFANLEFFGIALDFGTIQYFPGTDFQDFPIFGADDVEPSELFLTGQTGGDATYFISSYDLFQVQVVPLPAPFLLLASAIGMLGFMSRKTA